MFHLCSHLFAIDFCEDVLPLPRGDRLAVGIEVTMRNMNLALLLNVSLFGGQPELSGGVLFVVLFYAAVAMVAGLPLALNHRRLWRRERHAIEQTGLSQDGSAKLQ